MDTKRRLGLIAASLFLSGCNVVGSWSLASVDPNAARRDVEYHSMTLQKDHSFYAESKEETGVRTTSGTYTFEKGVLDLKAHDGERHTYDARLTSNTQLRLEGFWEGRKLKMKYERQE